MHMQELVRKARSIRRFDVSRPVDEAFLRGLVDLARLCPSAANRQPLRYRLVWRRDECAAIFPFIAWAAALKPWPGPAEQERPTGYIAMLGPAPDTDVGIAAQTLQLAAAEQGVGACMLGAIQRDKILRALGLPPAMELKLLIAFGRPAETVVLEEAPAGTDVSYYRTPDGVHHVPKRNLDDVVVG